MAGIHSHWSLPAAEATAGQNDVNPPELLTAQRR
jgi:hypothetical protein